MGRVLVPSPPQIQVVAAIAASCDSCGADARLVLRLHSGGELSFCGHHANQHAGQILRLARMVRRERDFPWRGHADHGTDEK